MQSKKEYGFEELALSLELGIDIEEPPASLREKILDNARSEAENEEKQEGQNKPKLDKYKIYLASAIVACILFLSSTLIVLSQNKQLKNELANARATIENQSQYASISELEKAFGTPVKKLKLTSLVSGAYGEAYITPNRVILSIEDLQKKSPDSVLQVWLETPSEKKMLGTITPLKNGKASFAASIDVEPIEIKSIFVTEAEKETTKPSPTKIIESTEEQAQTMVAEEHLNNNSKDEENLTNNSSKQVADDTEKEKEKGSNNSGEKIKKDEIEQENNIRQNNIEQYKEPEDSPIEDKPQPPIEAPGSQESWLASLTYKIQSTFNFLFGGFLDKGDDTEEKKNEDIDNHGEEEEDKAKEDGNEDVETNEKQQEKSTENKVE
jgi:hypothetical protein